MRIEWDANLLGLGHETQDRRQGAHQHRIINKWR
jgi:hypothetical protein